MKVAINGFGRIGRQFFLVAMQQKVKWDFMFSIENNLNNLYAVIHQALRARRA